MKTNRRLYSHGWLAALVAALLGGAQAKADIAVKPLQTFGYGDVGAMTVSTDGRFLVTAVEAGAFLWDIETGGLIRKFATGGPAVSCVALSLDGKRLATGTGLSWTSLSASVVALWDAESGQILRTFESPTNGVDIVSVACSPDGSQVIAGGSDGVAHLWDVATGQLRFAVRVLSNEVRAVEFSPDGHQFLTAGRLDSLGANSVAYLRDVQTGQILHSLTATNAGLWVATFSPDGSRVLLAGERWSGGGFASVWDATTGQLVSECSSAALAGDLVLAARFSADGTKVYSACRPYDPPAHLAELWDADTGQLIRTFPDASSTTPIEVIQAGTFLPDGQSLVTLASWYSGGTLGLCDLASGEVRHRFAGVRNGEAAAVSADGAWIVTGGAGACLWDAASGALLRTFEDPTNIIKAIAVSPSGAKICTGGTHSYPGGPGFSVTFRIWDTSSASVLHTLARSDLGYPLSDPVFSADGSRILIATTETSKTERHGIVWDVASGQVATEIAWTNSQYYSWASTAFSADGREVLVTRFHGQGGGQLLAFDVNTGQPTRTILSDWGESVHVTPDGRFAAEMGWGEESGRPVRIWDLQAGRVLRECVIVHGQWYVDGFALAGPQARFLIGQGYRSLIWDTETGGLPIRDIPIYSASFSPKAAVSPDGLHLVTSASVAELWDLSDLLDRDWYSKSWNVPWVSEEFQRTFGRGAVGALAASRDGKRLAVGYTQGTLVWDVSTAKPVLELNGLAANRLVYSSDGTKILGGLFSTRVWDAQTGELLRLFRRGYHEAVALSPDGNEIVSVTLLDSIARIWDENTGQLRFTLGGVDAVAISDNAQQLMTADSTVRLWDAGTGRLLYSLPDHFDGIPLMVFSPDGSRVLTGSWANPGYRLRLWNAATGQLVQTWLADWGIGPMVVSDDNQQIAVVTNNAAVLWDVQTGQQRSVLTGHGGHLTAIAYLPGGQLVATGSEDGTVELWDRTTGQLARSLSGSAQPVMFSSDGQGILVRSETGGARLWNLWTGDLIQEFEDYLDALLVGEYQSPYANRRSPDGRSSLTVNPDHPDLTDVVDEETGRALVTIDGEPSGGCFSPLHPMAVTTQRWWDRLTLWDTRVGQPLREFRYSSGGDPAFSPDGLVLVTQQTDGTVNLWDIRDLAIGLRTVVSAQGRELRWERGRLQEAEVVTGPWRDLWDASSPMPFSALAAQRFYRVVTE